MGGTTEGARKGVETLRQRRGEQFFKDRASKAGRAGKLSPALARKFGKLGAAKRWGSRRDRP